MKVIEKRNPYFSSDPKIVVWRMDPGTLRFLEVSGSAEALLGFTEQEWKAQDFWVSRMHPEDREQALEFCRSCTEDGKNHELEYRVLHRDGETVWIHEIVEVTEENGAPVVQGFVLDITHRVLKERDVARAYAYQVEFLRFLGREFDTPLNDAASFAELLVRHLAQQGDHVGGDYALGLREGLGRLSALSEEITRRTNAASVPPDRLEGMLYGFAEDPPEEQG